MKILEKVIDMCCTNPGEQTNHAQAASTSSTNEDVKEEISPKVQAVAAVAPQSSGNITDKESKYESVLFANLPADAKAAAMALGFDEKSWNESGWPESESKWWEDLTAEECKAATTLGWDKPAWDDKYESLNFADLPAHVVKAATSLGFTAEMWDGDRWPEFSHKHWMDLSEKEKSALNVLGWIHWKWDHSP